MYEEELMHYGVLGMKWGVRRRSPEERAAIRQTKRIAKGEKKQSKIRKKQESLRKDNDYEQSRIKESTKNRQSIAAQKLSSTVEKNRLERKIGTDDFWTTFGQRRAQDKVFNLNAKIKELEDMDLRERATIADAIENININNQKISNLNKKYERIGRKYLGIN